LRILVLLLLLANLTLFAYTRLDSMSTGDSARLGQQVQPDKIKVLAPQQVAALGPAKVAALADVCVEWGPLSETEKARALASLVPLDLGRLMSQKKVEVITNYWVYIPPAASKAAADKRFAELKAQGIRDLFLLDSGPQRFAISLGIFHTEEGAKARLAALEQQGITSAKVGSRAQSVQQSALVVRDPPTTAVTRLKELQSEFPGSDLKVGVCDKTG